MLEFVSDGLKPPLCSPRARDFLAATTKRSLWALTFLLLSLNYVIRLGILLYIGLAQFFLLLDNSSIYRRSIPLFEMTRGISLCDFAT